MTFPAELETGNEAIDSQHATLIAELELLQNVMGDSEPPGRQHVLHFIDFLRTHFTTHFEMEESLMSDVAYPDWPQHAEDHIRFFDIFIHHRAKVLATDADRETVENLVRALSEWVKHHVLDQDVKFARYYKEHAPLLRAKLAT